MQAILCTRYDEPPGNLELREVPVPEPGPEEIRIKVHATAINDYDWSMARGKPRLYRLMFGLTKPKRQIAGMELSGIVEGVGPEVDAFAVGDPVYGDISSHGFGSFAEYICIHQDAVRPKPAELSHSEACALPHAALLAYQGLFDIGNLQHGAQILINGAGGGVGTLGLQLAKMHEAEVTGVDTEPKLEQMKKLGFDRVIDYKKQDFTRTGHKYDLILDAKTGRSIWSYARALKPDGKYVTVGGKLGRLLQLLLLGSLSSLFSKKKFRILSLKPNAHLDKISELCVEGKLKPVIDGPYPLEKTPWAVHHFGHALHCGKVVIQIADENTGH